MSKILGFMSLMRMGVAALGMALAMAPPLRSDSILRTLTPQRSLESPEAVAGSVASPDGKLVALLLKSGSIRVVDMEKKATVRTIPRFGEGTATLAVAGDVLVAGVGRAVFVVDLARQEAPREIYRGTGKVAQVACFPLRSLVAIAGGEGLRVLNLATGETIYSSQAQPCLAVAFSPDGQTMAAVQGKVLTVYDLPNVIEKWHTAAPFFPSVLAYAQEGGVLGFAGDSNLILVNRVKDGTVLQRLSLGFSASKVVHLALTPDGSGLVAASDKKVHVFDSLRGDDPARRDVKLEERINGLLLSASAQSLLVSCEGTSFLQTFPTTLKLPDHLVVDFRPREQIKVIPPVVTILSPTGQEPVRGATVQVLAKVLAAPDQKLQSLKVLVDGRELDLAGTPLGRGTPLPAGAAPLKEGEELFRFEVPVPAQNCTVALLGETVYANSRLAVLKLRREAPAEVAGDRPKPRLQIVAPEVVIVQPAQDALVQGEAVQFLLRTRSAADQKVQSVQILVDGQQVEALGGLRPKGTAASLGVPDLKDDEEILLYSVQLPPRDCVVAVFAESQYANSAGATVRLRRPPPPKVLPPPPPVISIIRPTVEILSPRADDLAKADVANLLVKVTSSPLQPVSKVAVQVDGVSVAVLGSTGPSGAAPPAPGATEARFEEVRNLSVPLAQRNCIITVWAETAYANSEVAVLRVRRPEQALPPPQGAKPEVPSIIPPTVEIVAPSNEAIVKSDSVGLRVRLRYSPLQKLTNVRVLIDGTALPNVSLRGVRPQQDAPPAVAAASAPAQGTQGTQGPFAAPAMLEEVQDFNIPIPSKDCTVAVMAETAMANSELATVKLRYQERRKTDVNALPTLYILAVGVAAYQDPNLKLVYPAKDAKDFCEAMDQQKGKLYKEVKIKLLQDQTASRDNIMDGMEWLQKEVTQKDVAVLFFAGHGMNDPKTGQFNYLPYNADLNAVRRTMIANTDIMSTLDSLAGKRLLFLDSCNSSNVAAKGRTRGVLDIGALRKEFESAGQGSAVFAAAAGKQGAMEKESWNNGAFTKAILEGLKDGKADPLKTGRITVSMLNVYITDRVKELTEGFQTPIYRSQDDMGDFPVMILGKIE